MNLIKVLMQEADRRDPFARILTEDEAIYSGYAHIPARPGGQYSIVGIVKDEIEMCLEVFNVADPVELYEEKEYYIDKPHMLPNDEEYDYYGPYGEIV